MTRDAVVVVLLLAACGPASVPSPPCAPLEVAQPPRAAAAFVDDFEIDGPFVADFGLNDNLVARQSKGNVQSAWARLAGVWFPRVATPDQVRVGPLQPGESNGRLAMRGGAAARVTQPFAPGADGRLRVTFDCDPITDDVASTGWVSLTLSEHPDSRGWVNDPDAVLGLVLRSNGQVHLSSRSRERKHTLPRGPTKAAPIYHVVVQIDGWKPGATSALRVHATINDTPVESDDTDTSGRPLPASLYVQLGAHFNAADTPLSWFDDVRVDALPGPTPRADGPVPSQAIPEPVTPEGLWR